MATPLLLLHGALGSREQFELLSNKLRKFYEIHVLNFSGHGGGDLEGLDYSIDLFVRDVEEYLAGQNINAIHMFGYSMGGYVALRFAQKHPERALSVTTLGTKFDWTPETAAREQQLLDPGMMLSKVPEFAAMVAKRHAPADWKQVVLKTSSMMGKLGHGSALTKEDLSQIKPHVVLGIGDQDNMVTIQETKWADSALPNSEVMVLPGVAHPIERLTIDSIRSLLKRSLS